jgi:hypothetical protein
MMGDCCDLIEALTKCEQALHLFSKKSAGFMRFLATWVGGLSHLAPVPNGAKTVPQLS